MCVCFLGYFSPSVLLAQFGETKLGLQPQVTASCYTAMGVSALATRLCLGPITRLCGGPSALSKPSGASAILGRVHFVAQVVVGAIACAMPFCWPLARSVLGQ